MRSRPKTVSVHVSTYVDVELDEIKTEDLVDELVRRGRSEDTLPGDASSILQRLHVALKLGQDEQALVEARAFVCAHFGVIL
jgi:hypothetical protein